MVEGAEGRGLGHLPRLRSRGVLTLGQPVDLIVEQDDREIDVPAEGVEEVVASNREGVAVAGDHPYVQVRSAHRDSSRQRRRPPVYGMDPVSVHVVREAGTASDPRDEDRVLAPRREVGHEHLHRHQDRVVTTTGAPPDLLIAGPVLLGRHRNHDVSHLLDLAFVDFVLGVGARKRSRMACSISSA